MALPGYSRTLRFGDFVLDVAAYELRRDGRRVRLERQPMDLLILLVGQRGQLVSRSQIVDALWAKDVFVDVENGVNTAIRKLRQALRDAPDTPTFIETVPGKGYRFIAAVETLPDAAASPPPPRCGNSIRRRRCANVGCRGRGGRQRGARGRSGAGSRRARNRAARERAPCRGGAGGGGAGRGAPLGVEEAGGFRRARDDRGAAVRQPEW